MNDVKKLEKEILALQVKLERAKVRRKELDALDPEKRFAIYLRKRFCSRNHTDGCGFDYEISMENRWGQFAHAEWLKSAHEILAEVRSM